MMKLLVDLPQVRRLVRVHLAELDTAEAMQLATWLSESLPPGAAVDLERVVREAGGNPFLIDAMVREGHVAGGLSRVVAAALQGLSSTALRLLQTIAVAGVPLDRDVAQAVSHVREDEGLSIYAHLRAKRLVRFWAEGEKVEIYHHRIRECVLGQLTVEEVRDRRRELTLALQRAYARPETPDVHLHPAGTVEGAYHHLRRAAQRAAANQPESCDVEQPCAA